MRSLLMILILKQRSRYLLKKNLKDDNDFDAMVSSIKELAGQIIQLSPNLPSEASIILKNIENPSFLIHFVSSNLNSNITEKQKLLEIHNIKARAEVLMNLLQTELQYAELKNKVTNKTRAELDKQQKEYFLQQQLKAIKEELGGDNVAEVKEMQKKAEAKKWPASCKRNVSIKGLKNWKECILPHLIILLFIIILT